MIISPQVFLFSYSILAWVINDWYTPAWWADYPACPPGKVRECFSGSFLQPAGWRFSFWTDVTQRVTIWTEALTLQHNSFMLSHGSRAYVTPRLWAWSSCGTVSVTLPAITHRAVSEPGQTNRCGDSRSASSALKESGPSYAQLQQLGWYFILKS